MLCLSKNCGCALFIFIANYNFTLLCICFVMVIFNACFELFAGMGALKLWV